MTGSPFLRSALTVAGLCALAGPSAVAAEHLAPETALEEALVSQAEQRAAHLARVESLLSDKRAEEVVEQWGMAPARVRDAAAALDDETLASLSDRIADAEADFAAGAISDRELTLILIGVATLIIVLIIVAAA